MTITVVVILTIIANVLISYKGFNDRNFFAKYMFNIGKIQQGERYRMISSAFLHADVMHLLFNMFALYIFSPIVTGYFGGITFLIIYFVALLCGNLFTLNQHSNEPNYSAIGASGAVTGIVYGSIVIFPYMSLYLFFIPIPIPAYIFAIGYMLYSLYGMKKQTGNVGHTAHIGGAVGGLIATGLFDFNLIIANYLIILLMIVPIVLYLYQAKK